MFSFLPTEVQKVIERKNIEDIYEVRLRVGKPMFIRTKNNLEKINFSNGYVLDKRQLAQTVLRLTEHSVYAHIDSLKQGYITTEKGVRVGICGECVKEDNQIKMVKEITSMCIRIPHEIKGVSNSVVERCFSNQIKNLLIISPPSGGKTTMLRDIIRNLSNNYNYNILVVDERLEISALGAFDLGDSCDILSYSSKEYGFYQGVKSMNPQIIATDELSSASDVKGAVDAVFSGVNIIATAHAENVSQLKRKEIFSPIFANAIFDYAVILRNEGKFLRVQKLDDI